MYYDFLFNKNISDNYYIYCDAPLAWTISFYLILCKIIVRLWLTYFDNYPYMTLSWVSFLEGGYHNISPLFYIIMGKLHDGYYICIIILQLLGEDICFYTFKAYLKKLINNSLQVGAT